MNFIYRQLLQGVLVIWIVLSATFILVRFSGDPVAILLPENPPQGQDPLITQ